MAAATHTPTTPNQPPAGAAPFRAPASRTLAGNRLCMLRRLDAAARRDGLSFVQVAALRYLDASVGHVWTATLAAHLSLPLPYAADLIDGLARLGVLVRDQDPWDNRGDLIRITDAGIERLRSLWQTLRLEVELMFPEHTGTHPPA